MSDYELPITQRAKDDIIDIGDYITYELLVPEISLQFIKNLRNAIQQLRNFPYKFPFVQNEYLKQQEIRCMPYKNCLNKKGNKKGGIKKGQMTK